MRIFVTGTGRCGTCTFYQAVRHAVNYTAGHESRAGIVDEHDYPDGHIEVSAHLAAAIPQLRERYPGAKWVHLTRDREACVRSLAGEVTRAIACYARIWFQCSCGAPDEVRDDGPHAPLRDGLVLKAAGLFYDQVNALCEALLPDAYRLRLETAKEQWPECWDFMGCRGSLSASTAEWERAYNPRGKRGRNNFVLLDD